MRYCSTMQTLLPMSMHGVFHCGVFLVQSSSRFWVLAGLLTSWSRTGEPQWINNCKPYESCCRSKDVARLDGAQGKKQVWRPCVQSWGLSEANVLYWRKYLWHCWDFSAPGELYPPWLSFVTPLRRCIFHDFFNGVEDNDVTSIGIAKHK